MTAATASTASPSRGRIIAARTLLVLGVLLARGQHPLHLRQAGGARLRPVQADLAEADRRPGDPGGGRGPDDRRARERRLLGRARGEAADEPPGARRARSPASRRASSARRRRTCSPGRASRTRSSRRPCSRRSSSSRSCTATRRRVDTSNGDVVLDIRPLVLKLGDRFGFVSNLADQIPQDAGQVTILKADNLKTAQKITHWLEQIANFIWIFAVAAWVGSDLARPRAAPAGGSLARHRSRRRRRARAPRAVARREGTSSIRSSPATRCGRRPTTRGRSSRSRSPRPAGSRSRSASSSRSAPGSSGPGDRATAARVCDRSAPAAVGDRLGRAGSSRCC